MKYNSADMWGLIIILIAMPIALGLAIHLFSETPEPGRGDIVMFKSHE